MHFVSFVCTFYMLDGMQWVSATISTFSFFNLTEILILFAIHEPVFLCIRFNFISKRNNPEQKNGISPEIHKVM